MHVILVLLSDTKQERSVSKRIKKENSRNGPSENVETSNLQLGLGINLLKLLWIILLLEVVLDISTYSVVC